MLALSWSFRVGEVFVQLSSTFLFAIVILLNKARKCTEIQRIILRDAREFVFIKRYILLNKCIGYDTNAAARQCPNYITQELSYRKQIARQLRTQYAEGIYDNPVTLKSRLTVTQGHWKRNH